MPGGIADEATARYRHIAQLIRHDFAPPARVVELGAAPGDQIVALAELGFSTTAVDIGISSDEWGSGRAGAMDQMLSAAGVRYVEWNLEIAPYPLEDAAFEVVVMTEVFEHLRDYPIRSLREAARVLAPGGRLYFTSPNAAYVVNRARALAGRSTATPLSDWIAGLPHARHAREYTFAEVRELLELAGLRPVALTSRHFFRSEGSARQRAAKAALDALSRLRPTLGPTIIAVAEPA